MTFREKREHKFKILFMYSFQNGDLNSIIDNYFDNLPYDEKGDDFFDDETKNVHKNIAINSNSENIPENESDKAVLSITDDDNIYDIKFKLNDLISKMNEIDSIIKDNLSTWDLNRVAKAELTIIRLAVYEMYFDVSIDIPVAINEAVELAKLYGDEKAQKFVNGVLSTIYKSKPDCYK